MSRHFSNIRAVGIPWYRQEDWPALIAIFEDGAVFDSFEQWLARAEELERQFQRDGYVVERAYIDPDTFPQWCRQNGVGADREGRGEFAAEGCRAKIPPQPELSMGVSMGRSRRRC
jgi:hypothetical protein